MAGPLIRAKKSPSKPTGYGANQGQEETSPWQQNPFLKMVPELQHSWVHVLRPQQSRKGQLSDLLARWIPGAPSSKPGLTMCLQRAVGPLRTPPTQKATVEPTIYHGWAFCMWSTLSLVTQVVNGSHLGKAGLTRSPATLKTRWVHKGEQLTWPQEQHCSAIWKAAEQIPHTYLI